MTITKLWADDFVHDWVEAWNTHDLVRVLSHYTDDFEMSSPFIAQFTGESSGVIAGKDTIAAYWRTALQSFQTCASICWACLSARRASSFITAQVLVNHSISGMAAIYAVHA